MFQPRGLATSEASETSEPSVSLAVTAPCLAETALLLIVSACVGVESATVLVMRLFVESLLLAETVSVLESGGVVILIGAAILVGAL